jgi:hypothetical protein
MNWQMIKQEGKTGKQYSFGSREIDTFPFLPRRKALSQTPFADIDFIKNGSDFL